MLTVPTTVTEYRTLQVEIYSGVEGSTLYFLPIPQAMIQILTDDDLTAMIQVVADRLQSLDPTNPVYHFKNWTGIHRAGPLTIHEATPAEEP